MKLSIVVPAYNEEQAIADIIKRCLASKDEIIRVGRLSGCEVIVVNDGSSDRTHEIAAKFAAAGEIKLISYAKNRGYGAAIKQGFAAAEGDLLGFLDADGTCDPLVFGALVERLQKEGADVSIGSRMGPESQMPRIRRIGNKLYVHLINWIGRTKITDSASGMRVIRKSSLGRVFPLPDGMNFTPAMSTKAVLDHELKIVETFMPYRERVGRSKLSVLKDGARFLKTIVEAGLFYRPIKLFVITASIFFLIGLSYGIPLVIFYLKEGRLLETDIYRIVTIVVMGISGVNILLSGIIADDAASIFTNRPRFYAKLSSPFLESIFSVRFLLVSGALLILSGVVLNHQTMFEYARSRSIHVHWVYIITGGFLILVGLELLLAAFLKKILKIYAEVLEFRRMETPR